MSIYCSICGSRDLRFSRFKLKDIPRLILFRYPMRCWVCRDRDYRSMLQILMILRDKEVEAERKVAGGRILEI